MDELARKLVVSMAKLAMLISDSYDTVKEVSLKLRRINFDVGIKIPEECARGKFRVEKPFIISTFWYAVSAVNDMMCFNRGSEIELLESYPKGQPMILGLVRSASVDKYIVDHMFLAKLLSDGFIKPVNDGARKYSEVIADKVGDFVNLALVREIEGTRIEGKRSIEFHEREDAKKIVEEVFGGRKLNAVEILFYIQYGYDEYVSVSLDTHPIVFPFEFSKHGTPLLPITEYEEEYLTESEVRAGLVAVNLSVKQLVLLAEKLL